MDERAKGAVSTWVQSWWRTKKGDDWGGLSLEEVSAETMFELKDLKAARLWLVAPAVMETALGCLEMIDWATPNGPAFS